ncbi:MAG TPA: hypothetical protein VD866_04450 [Urbifossiella sp.]|nr:hypothetical protein [Urbifossiella sp.]
MPPSFDATTVFWLPDAGAPPPHDGLVKDYCHGELPPDVRHDVAILITNYRAWYDTFLRVSALPGR